MKQSITSTKPGDPSSLSLAAAMNADHLLRIETTLRKHWDLPLEAVDPEGRTLRARCSRDWQPTYCATICHSRAGRKRCQLYHRHCVQMAFEIGAAYTSYCHAGILLVCVPVADHDHLLGGLCLGKCLTEGCSEVILADMNKRLLGLSIKPDSLAKAAQTLSIVSARSLHEAAEFLYVLLYEVTGLDPRIIDWHRYMRVQQSEISAIMQQWKHQGGQEGYSYQTEQILVEAVQQSDKLAAHQTLNVLLGAILIQHPNALGVLKARLLELLGILSRSVAEAGADVNPLLERNTQYINRIIEMNDQQPICAWMHTALDDFLSQTRSLRHPQPLQRLQSAQDYMEQHYQDDIGVNDIAHAAHLSVSRLSHLFKEQMKTTLVTHLNRLRIRAARQRLLETDQSCTEICFAVGFRNLSYFNRIFRRQVGMTPTAFRRHNLRVINDIEQGPAET